MASTRVLVVDDDPWILRMVTATLEKRNFVVDTARDGQQALVRANAAAPNLVITDVMMPVMDGWTFVQQLRRLPKLASIPVLFLTALGKDEARLRQLGLGARDVLSKPFRFEDLDHRVMQALSGSQGDSPSSPAPVTPDPPGLPSGLAYAPTLPYPTVGPSQSSAESVSGKRSTFPPDPSLSGAFPADSSGRKRTTALNGHLEQLGLSSLLVMMEMERKDGVLALGEADSGRIGRIFLRKGQVICARIDKNPDSPGRECVYDMLSWQRGRFSFAAMEVEMEDTIQSSTTHLLMEGARLIDESNR